MPIETEIRALDARIEGIEGEKSSTISDFRLKMKRFEDELSKFRKERLALMERSIIYGEY